MKTTRIVYMFVFIQVFHITVVDGVCNVTAQSCSDCLNGSEPDEACGWCAHSTFQGARCGDVSFLKQNRCPERKIEIIYSRNTLLEDAELSPTQRLKPQSINTSFKVQHGRVIDVPFQALTNKRWLIARVSYSSRKFRVTMTSSCRFRWQANGRGRCFRTRPGQTLNFKLQIVPVNCDARGRIRVSITGDSGKKLTIRVSSRCVCGCEAEKIVSHMGCHGNGNMTCGQCECEPGFFGDNCVCRHNNVDTCRSGPGSQICSERGDCVCGNCHCRPVNGRPKYFGRYCECDNTSCEIFNGLLCGGTSRGVCRCGHCQCRAGYIGSNCGHLTSTDSCRSDDGELCNRQGDCVGGRCTCRHMSGYSGPTCEECSTCIGLGAGRCQNDSPDSCRQRQGQPICSGRGHCVCGECECMQVEGIRLFYGRFCECNDLMCARFNGLVCGGPSRGACRCGSCQCLQGYSGSSCNLTTSTDSCRSTNGGLCNENGDCIEGRCRCQGGYVGPTCEECPSCSGVRAERCENDSPDSCRSRPGQPICNGRGDCICGMCNCMQVNDMNRYSGRFCQCDDYSCERHLNKLCGGPSQGVCRCGRCQCLPGYDGSSCQLSTLTDMCLAANGELCNGQGVCVNGRCICEDGYIGPTCELCLTCTENRCGLLKNCVECVVFNSGPLDQEQCYSQCQRYGIRMVQTISEIDPGQFVCQFIDAGDSCRYQFIYGFDEDGELFVKVDIVKECPQASRHDV